MIICNSRKFIFVHLHKCAGTSVTDALRPFLSQDDLVVMGPPNESHPLVIQEPNLGILRKHSTAQQIAQAIGDSKWNTYFKFAFVRHPLDRLVSLYEFFNRVKRNHSHQIDAKQVSKPGRVPIEEYPDEWPWNWPGMQAILSTEDFSGFIRSEFLGKAQGANPQASALTDQSGNLIVDFVGKVENLTDDWKQVCSQLEIQAVLTRQNKSERQFDAPGNYWTQDNLDFVLEKYRVDFELFSYSPEKISETG